MNGQMDKSSNRLVRNQVKKLQACSWVLLTDVKSATDEKAPTDVDQRDWQAWEWIQKQARQQWES